MPQTLHFWFALLLLNYLPEVMKLARKKIPWPAQDEMTAGLRIMIGADDKPGECPMHAIFTTKLFLSVHHVLQADHRRPFEELQATAKGCLSAVDSLFEFTKNKEFENWPGGADAVMHRVQACAQFWALDDRVERGNDKAKSLEGAWKSEPFLFLKTNPIACGLLTFHLNLLFQSAGIVLAEAWKSAIFPIHLYNTCRQSSLLAREWEDAEYTCQVHTPERIFFGAPPKNVQDITKRHLLALGCSAQNFARNQRQAGTTKIARAKKRPEGLKRTSPVN